MRIAGRVTLLRHEDLLFEGLTDRSIRRERDAGRLFLVRPGVFTRPPVGEPLSVEERAVARAVAWDEVARDAPVFSHLTAAAIHGLPVWGAGDGRVHVIVPDARPGAAVGLIRHRGVVDADDVVIREGVRITSLARTVADVARTAGREVAVCIADAALRKVAFGGHGAYDTARADGFRETALEIAGRSAHGVHRARAALDFADGRADLPGESVSRVRLVQLGFASPRLQVPIRGPHGSAYWVDFGLDDVDAWGEFDGRGKYRDLLRRSGGAAEVLRAEKEREDWIRGTTGRRVLRWGAEHVGTARALGDRLAAFGVSPPSRR